MSKLFDIRPPYLGFKDHRASSELMTVKLKVYERGGENRMHHHDGEDHCFVILQGQATFRLGTDDNLVVLGEGDGILIERGDDYWFENTGVVDLQILRIGAIDPAKPQHANFADGSVKHGRKD